jgi:23S rRNA pseudouridine1911/1915/1917 synthase
VKQDDAGGWTFTVGEGDGGLRLDIWLARCADLSRSRVQTLVREGALVDMTSGAACLVPKAVVAAGSTYRLHLPEPVAAEPQPQAIALAVVYEDADLLVLNKPAGLVVHPSAGHADGTLVNALLHHCKDLQGIGGTLRPGIVHRLDKDTSGLLVVAKHERAMLHLTSQFQSRSVRKVYQAIAAGVPDRAEGRIETLIGRSRHDRKKMSTTPAASGKPAISNFKVQKASHGFSLLDVHIETGRTHQIRVHLAHIGCPVAGDRVYGSARARMWTEYQKDLRQMLHAASLAFRHPETGVEMSFAAPLPADMLAFGQFLGLL